MSGVNTMHTGWWVGEKFRRKTFRLRRRCRLPFQLAGCCWNMEMAAWLVALTSRDPEYSCMTNCEQLELFAANLVGTTTYVVGTANRSFAAVASQRHSLTAYTYSKIARICLYLRAHARALRHI